ncbi:DNA replication factor Cdt1 isoform X2 [Prorops nasuta]|uniref:DNA replication factor Cdt1 isoform X2 n=1 Tax=Prorops nasuta TaxID=863751 RepID=UPI0034CD3D5E
MSQPSVTAYFNTRKRHAREDLINKAKFDSPKTSMPKAARSSTIVKITRSQKALVKDSQVDIRDSFCKVKKEQEPKNVTFNKIGSLSPRKKRTAVRRNPPAVSQNSKIDEIKESELPVSRAVTPTKIPMKDNLMENQDLSLGEIKRRIIKSSRLEELKASIARFKNCEEKLNKLNNREERSPEIKKFDNIQLEIPVSPQKLCKSPSKAFLSPVKNIPDGVSSAKRLLFDPKEKPPSPIKGSPTKAPAYQRYLSLAENSAPALPLPYNYRFLAEVFRAVDTVIAMLFNRKEIITFKKLKPAVQELLRRNFTLEHVAQIKTIYPEAFSFNQEKYRSYGTGLKEEQFELIITPIIKSQNGRDVSDGDTTKTASETNMSPTVLVERMRFFYNTLLERVKDEHEKFLRTLNPPLVIPKGKVMRWHPEFDVESCKMIEVAELPQPPNVEKVSSAKDALEKAKTLFNCGTKMEKALQRLAESQEKAAQTADGASADLLRKNDTSVVDTPPATPTTQAQSSYLETAFKGIPKSLLEKVRAKQAAKALEIMTRTPNADKEAALYSRLPELAKILRNIFVAEKKGVLALEFVINKLDNSFRTKLTSNELEEHLRLMCNLLPTWLSLHVVRKVNYLKLSRDVDLLKVIRRLEVLANEKVTAS